MSSPERPQRHPSPGRPRRSRRGDAAAVTLLVVGIVLGLVGYRLWSFARASAGTAYPITMTAGEYLLFGGGAVACLVGAVVLIAHGRRRSR
ncbi:hypothetical protein GCG21_10585 [Pseudactinotalea sp. HY160]|uniref:hypothetical protein n=1 Tax=Pseudactinotalea sp. HY160 TaxID=2654490 RepID=UPI00128CF572|nr:hypothetical protein [Pseudactinotalea sp. HY160]MPV50440.1 hypothetical protein [Pseudactinotalea sp. HY160]